MQQCLNVWPIGYTYMYVNSVCFLPQLHLLAQQGLVLILENIILDHFIHRNNIKCTVFCVIPLYLINNRYGYATNTRIKFIIITENTTSHAKDNEISPVSWVTFENEVSTILQLWQFETSSIHIIIIIHMRYYIVPYTCLFW